MFLSIVIPAYNEARRIGKTLDKYLSYYKENHGQEFEIIVVLNGCRDETETIVESYSQKHPQLKYLVVAEPIGKGGAIARGMMVAKGDLVSFTDADNSTRPEILNRLFQVLELIPAVDCVIGSRNLPGSVVQGRPQKRKILTRGFNWGVNFLFDLKIKDTQCGAKVLRRDLIPKILPKLSISNMAFDVNLLVDIKKVGGNILEIPIEWEDETADSTIKNPSKTSVIMALSVVRLWLIYSPAKILYPILNPFGKLVWKLLLTEDEIKYRKIANTSNYSLSSSHAQPISD